MTKTAQLFKQSLVASAAFAACCSWAPARAQAVPAAAAASAPSPASLETVTVTAQKRTENARDVSSSVSVVGSEQLENRHVSSLVDLAGSLPGVQIESGGSPGRTAISIRGISSLDVGAVVGTYIDDSPLGSSSRYASASRYQLDLMPYDIDRIEVLRGPQGTLYGASTMGGLLKYVLREPELNGLSGAVGGGVSTISGASRLGFDSHAMINVPVKAGELAFSASVSQNKTPGYVDNAVTGQNDINGVTQEGGRFAVKWKPSNDFSVKFNALHQQTDSKDLGAILLDANQAPIYGELQTGTVIPEGFSTHLNFYSATVNWDLGLADLTSATSYSSTRTDSTKDDSAFYGPLFPAFGFAQGRSGSYVALDLKKTTEELRLASKPGTRTEWLVGFFYTRESVANHQLLTATSDDGTPLPVLNPLLGVEEPSTYREAAVFGDLTYKLTDSFDVAGGLRYAKNTQHASFTYTGVGAALQGLTDSTNDSSEGITTWMLSPRFKIDANNMVYLRGASGYRPGSSNIALPGVPTEVKSDTLINYEAGWKGLLLDKTLSVEAAVYRIDWKGIQLNNSTPAGVSYLANAGKAQSQGVELTLQYSPIPGVRMGLNGAYTKAHLTEDAPSLGGKTGDQIPNIPLWNAATTADYYFMLPLDLAAHVGADYRFTGARDSSFKSATHTWREESFGVVGLNGDVSKGIWTVRLYAKNLTNVRPHQNISYLANGATGNIATLQSTALQPRTIGLEVNAQF